LGSEGHNQYQPFTVEEMAWIRTNIAVDDPKMRLLLELGVFTGCRISELCNLTPERIIQRESISTDSAKCFHSFRVMFATPMQQAEVDELKAAAILGHKRGNTMTYGYYSKGYELRQLKDAYDKCVERLIW
jgi:integrase|tara:strand:- start:3239 stop:3631 length:393 start_codon:yes stop_codon:yes gene_type:complete